MAPEHFRRVSFNGGSVTFPKDWRAKGDDGQQYVVRALDGLIQATLSIFYFSTGASVEEDKQVFDRFLTLRLQAEKAKGKNIVVEPPTFSTGTDGTMNAIYEGTEGTVRHFSAKLAMHGGTLVVVYLEAVGQAKGAMTIFSHKIFKSFSFT